MLHNRSAWNWIGYLSASGLCLVIAYLMDGGSVQAAGVRSVLAVIGLIFGVAGVVVLGDWIAEIAIYRFQQARVAMAITPETKMIERIGTLTPEQCGLLRDEALIVRMIAGNPKPLQYLVLPGNKEIPMSFVRLFLQLSSGGYLAAIRNWGEGTVQRENAQAMTHFLIIHGYADTARGNNPARWLDRHGALARFGLDEMALETDEEDQTGEPLPMGEMNPSNQF